VDTSAGDRRRGARLLRHLVDRHKENLVSAHFNDAWVPVEHGHAIGRRDSGQLYSNEEIAELLDAAGDIGFDLSPESPLDDCTMSELAMLVRKDLPRA
jgi:hypothetical protein